MEYDVSQEQTKLKVWSLGQHWGLLTPLIDLTLYPYHALFFAFAEAQDATEDKRAVFALDVAEIQTLNFEITETHGSQRFQEKLGNPPYTDEFAKYLVESYGGIHPEFHKMVSAGTVPDAIASRLITDHHQREKKKALKLYQPSSNENKRIHSQGGWHLYTPDNVAVEDWILRHNAIRSASNTRPVLTKIILPDNERKAVLTSLNNLTLFPDFEGAAKHCNLALNEGYLGRIRDY